MIHIGADGFEGRVEEIGGNQLTKAEWQTARKAFHTLARRNLDGVSSKYETNATERMQKFLQLGHAAEVHMLQNLRQQE